MLCGKLLKPWIACIGIWANCFSGSVALDTNCIGCCISELTCPVASAGEEVVCPAVCATWLDACTALFRPVCAAAWATVSAAAAGAAGEAPIGAIGGGTVRAAIKALSAPEYVQPTLELCGQCSPKYSESRSTIAGVLMPKKLVAFRTPHSSRVGLGNH
ncbi:hypothetical protein LRC484719_12370 [Mycobacterium riyadhense]